MDPLSAISAQIAIRATAAEARSALPDAPVVSAVQRTSTAPHTRAALAAGLHRLADAVAPRHPAALCADC